MKQYYKSIEVADQAKLLGYELWGYAPNENIRLSKTGESQPTFTLSAEEITEQFLRKYEVRPVRKNSVYIVAYPKG